MEDNLEISFDLAQVEDAQALLDYTKKVGAETEYLTFGPEGIQASLEQEEWFIQTVSQSTNQLLLVAKDGEKIIGVGSVGLYHSSPRFAHVGELGISLLQAYWGQGIGSGLMENILDWAIHYSNLTRLYLTVVASNQAAIGLYEKFGFVIEGRLSQHFHSSKGLEDILCMGINLEEVRK